MSNNFANITGSAMGILKNYYAGPIVSQFNDMCPLWKAAEKGKEKYNGLQVIRPLKVLRNPGIGATSDGGPLPSIGNQTVQQANIQAVYNYLRFGVTAPMIKASQGDKGSFVSIMEYEMNEGVIDFKDDMNRQLFWNGRGDLAVVNASAVASNVITVAGRTPGEEGNKYLFQTMVVDIVNPVTSVYSAQQITINAVSGSAVATLTLSAPVTVNSGDIIVRAGAYNLEIQGLKTALDGQTTTIFGINRAQYPQFQGNYIDNLGGQLTLNAIQLAVNEPRRRGGNSVDAAFCDFTSERYYTKLLVSDKRYIGERVIGDGTFLDKNKSYLEIAGVPLQPDKDCTSPQFYFLAAAGWRKYILGSELEWADESGSYMIAQIGADAYESRLRLFGNTFMEKPSANSTLVNFISP